MTFGLRMGMVTIGLIVFFLAIGTLQRPPVESIQRGYRGLGMIELYHPASLLAEENANRIPEPSPKINWPRSKREASWPTFAPRRQRPPLTNHCTARWWLCGAITASPKPAASIG